MKKKEIKKAEQLQKNKKWLQEEIIRLNSQWMQLQRFEQGEFLDKCPKCYHFSPWKKTYYGGSKPFITDYTDYIGYIAQITWICKECGYRFRTRPKDNLSGLEK